MKNLKAVIFLGLISSSAGFAQSSFATSSCKDSVALEAAQTAQVTYGGETTDTECKSDYNTIHLMDDGRYSVSVHCRDDIDDITYDVSVAHTPTGCVATIAIEDLESVPFHE